MFKLLPSLLILLTAFFLRVMTLDYAIDDVCLTPQSEYWLTNTFQPTSLYTVNVGGNLNNESQIAPTPQDRAVLRYVGSLVGIVTVSMTLWLMKAMRSPLSLAIVLFVALSPWFVAADRWIVAFDFASFLIAICVAGLWFLHYKQYSRWMVWLVVFSAMSLLLVAPPLWWLMVALLMTIPERPWRKVAFAFVMILVLIPSLRSPLEWFHATQLWDTGTTAALIWLILIALAFFGRNLPRGFGVALTAIALLSGIVSFADNYRLLRPSQEDWNVITALQNAFPDGVTAAFPPSLYRYVDVIRCPMRDDIKFTPIVYLPHPDSTDVLLTVVEGMPESSEHLQPLDSRYTLIRHVKFANAMLSSVGNQFVVLNAELLTPSLVAGGILNIRLDMQFTNQLDEQFSVYGLFVHVTKLDQADEKVLQYGYPIGQEMGTIQKRDMIDNYHVRMALPVDIAVGTYDVIVGFTHNVEVKELARWVVGQVEVLSP